MYCYVCAESIRDGENYCRGCGAPAASFRSQENGWLSTLANFALGFLCFGLFTILFTFFSVDIVRFTFFGRFLVLAIAGGLALGFAIHFYSRQRTPTANNKTIETGRDETSVAGLLVEPTPISFVSVSESLGVPTTSELKPPRSQ